MKYLTREDILNAQDFVTETVNVPEWGGKVVVKSMSGEERDSFEASIIEMKGKNTSLKMENMRAKLVSKTVIDNETKKPIFTPADISALGKKSATALDRVFSVAQRLSKISQEDVDELVKN